MVLHRMILPAMPENDKKELYFRGHAESGEQFSFRSGNRIMFDTYFNAFFYRPYLKYTRVKHIRFRIITSGNVYLSLICIDKDGNEKVIDVREANGEYFTTVFSDIALDSLPEDGAVFLCAEASGSTAVIHDGCFETDLDDQNDIRVAAVICTYKREDYIYRNLEMIKLNIWDAENCPVNDNIDVFVVDNGKTVQFEDSEQIKVFPNKNCGGSGGFTRGLLEAYRCRGHYSHVLFMDDDISFEIETLVRTIQFLKTASVSDRPLCIGGQMLIQDKPTIQYESGACYRNGRLVPNNHGLDVSKRMALLENMKDKSVEYNAWWYFCFPISVVDRHGLPLPFFIKTDDIEYSLRIEPQIVLINGIGVWHIDFEQKYSIHLEYYVKRNELVVSAIHGSGAGIIPSMRKLILSCGKAALISNPQNVDFILRAYRDFMKGPDFFLSTDSEQLNGSLIQARERPAKSRIWSIISDPFRLLTVIIQLVLHYNRIRCEYIRRMTELMSTGFWCRQLGLTGYDDA